MVQEEVWDRFDPVIMQVEDKSRFFFGDCRKNEMRYAFSERAVGIAGEGAVEVLSAHSDVTGTHLETQWVHQWKGPNRAAA